MIDKWIEEGEEIEEVIKREQDIQRQIEGDKIEKARYNKRYKKFLSKEVIPEYLKKEMEKIVQPAIQVFLCCSNLHLIANNENKGKKKEKLKRKERIEKKKKEKKFKDYKRKKLEISVIIEIIVSGNIRII
ncbi:hypothetical protein PUN28_020540 [Cardiocondyla obscurior]|uniref:Uncharacterized protein n=1 Tax=Cardiocondyla obscurior TaxID=286306 RepID=A0AAW2E879_9HYME